MRSVLRLRGRSAAPVVLALAVAALLASCTAMAQGKVEQIRQVTIGRNAEFRVNGKPFLPIAVWLADPRYFGAIKGTNVNTLMGYAGESEPGKIVAYAEAAWAMGLYFVAPYDRGLPAQDYRSLVSSPNLLGWIQDDEPDLTRTVSDADVAPAAHMRVNRRTPFASLVDGDTSSWTVIEPVVGGEFTVRLKRPVTVQSLAVWQTISEGLAVAKGVTFLGDGKEILRATLENRTGQQKLDLKQPATFKELTLRFTSQYDLPGNQGYASLSEVEAFDDAGNDVLLSRPRKEPRATPGEMRAAYRDIRAADHTRPVFMTLTSAFMRNDTTWDPARKEQMYPALAKAADVLGFDTYPISGSGFPGRLHDVADGTADLRALAGPGKPIYAWIETNKGSQWMTPSLQPDVRPEHTRAEVWMAIIQGAKAIGYFTHKWFDPDGTANYSSFAPSTEMQAELERLNDQLTRLAPAIVADPAGVRVQVSMSDDLLCHAKATEFGGALYIFAQNIDLGKEAATLRQFDPISPRSGKGTITVEGLKAGTEIQVVDENRTIKAEAGGFTDGFGPLAEHIYRIPWRRK